MLWEGWGGRKASDETVQFIVILKLAWHCWETYAKNMYLISAWNNLILHPNLQRNTIIWIHSKWTSFFYTEGHIYSNLNSVWLVEQNNLSAKLIGFCLTDCLCWLLIEMLNVFLLGLLNSAYFELCFSFDGI